MKKAWKKVFSKIANKKPWKTIDSNIRYKNQWIRVREDRIVRPDGKKGIYGVVELPGSSAIVAVDQQQQTFLIKQYRYPLQTYTLELPWGSRKKGESYLQAAKRELREEGGVIARKWIYLGTVADTPGICDEYVNLYLACSLTIKTPIIPPEEGIQCVVRLPFKRIYRWALNGTIKDAVTIAGIVRAKQYIKI